ncbi:DNA polymerase Y family protein [Actinomyces respiraculi]|uniref:DNA polymerase Y family protein n=1 Tax=Actinomyces respiraculi TaxID=2744574 RepID=UPI00141EC0B9|nr:DNA polymerase Y family protein [Actinomyces respiraculi]
MSGTHQPSEQNGARPRDTGPVPAVPRLLAIWVPDWPVVALTLEQHHHPPGLHHPDKGPGSRPGRTAPPNPALEPVAVVGARGVRAASAPARTAGVRRGMRLRLARSLCPELVVLPPDPAREARAFEPVMDALSTVLAEPVVARPGLALSGARGPAHWFGGEEEVASALVDAVARDVGVECLVGGGDSLLAAILAARSGILVPEGQSAAFLAPWDLGRVLAALPTEQERARTEPVLEALARLGVRTLGDLAALPRADVTARFGPAGERAHRLATGEAWQVPSSPRPAADIEAALVLDPPVERADAAAFASRTLAERLSSSLVAHGLAAGRLLVEAECEDGSLLSRSWALETVPSPADLTDRVRWQIEGWLAARPGARLAGALVRLRLLARETFAAGTSQTGLWSAPGEEGRRRAARAAERVESLLGAGSVSVPVLDEGWDPRSRARLVPWGQHGPDSPVRAKPGRGAASDDGRATWVGSLPSPSPSRVLAEPAPTVLLDAQGREVLVDAQGQLTCAPWEVLVDLTDLVDAGSAPDGRQRVRSWAGPWPVDEGWWRPTGALRRAYLQLVPQDGPALLLVRRSGWWLEGIYS